MMDWLTNVYLGCFIFGLIFTVASFLLGGLDHFAIGGHIGGATAHTGHGHATHTQAHTNANQSHQQESLGWFNFSALVVFLTWFGGAGFIFTTLRMGEGLSAILAVVSGIVGYMVVLLFLTKILLPSQTSPMQAADYDLTGTVARVSSTIFENGVGEVIFSKHGSRRSVAARSVDGQPFPRESQVVILRFEKGIALVDDLNRLLSEAGAEKWSTAQLENPSKLGEL